MKRFSQRLATSILGLLLSLSACVVAKAQEGTTSAVMAQDSVKLQDMEGRTFGGPLLKLDATTIRLGGPVPRDVPLRDVVRIMWPANKLQAQTADSVVVLSNGDQIGLQLDQANEETLSGHWTRFSGWSGLRLPLESVRGIIVSPPRDQESRSRLWDRLDSYQTRNDLLLLLNGDSLAGQWLGFKEGNFQWKTTVGSRQVEINAVQGLFVNPDLINRPAENETIRTLVCRLTDGSSVTLKDPRFPAGGKLTGTLVAGPKLELSLSSINEAFFLGGRATYLSDLRPESYRFTPFLTQEWPLRKDRSVLGAPLRLRGVEYSKGLGMHSRSEVTYRLDGRYQKFHSTIGVDDETRGKGSVIFEVTVDGKSAYKSPVLTGTSQAVSIPPVSVSGARTLTLTVDYATQGDIQDHANWCQALLVN